MRIKITENQHKKLLKTPENEEKNSFLIKDFIKIINEEFRKSEDTKKADIVSDSTKEFFKTLENIKSPIQQQNRGSMSYQKNVETVQIGLILLGYELPRYGVDGLFGPETAAAVNKFKSDNRLLDKNLKGNSVMDINTIKLLAQKLKTKHITPDILKKYTNRLENFSDKDFYKKLLESLGAPISDENLKFLYAWRQSEGKGGRYNPFNTTMNMPGATNFNSVGVKNYLSLQDGLIATVKTLKLRHYTCIVNGLRNDIGSENIANCRQALSTWGTGSLVSKTLASYAQGRSPKIPNLG